MIAENSYIHNLKSSCSCLIIPLGSIIIIEHVVRLDFVEIPRDKCLSVCESRRT